MLATKLHGYWSVDLRNVRQKAAIRRYLASGDHDPNIHLWPGQNFVELEINTHTALRGALIDAVKERAAKVPKLPSCQAYEQAMCRP